ncbi:MAG: TIGR03790 family protein [Syntrophobacterales bacterium]|jgi:uncharacterized protein (TIGR03790 family)|nr:TIGR03790 family protein [Syntrophobacterales bacterium]
MPSLRQVGLVCLLILGILAGAPAAALALAPGDLVVVYNRNLPDSQAVAAYYAQHRKVPAENLVGVEVPASEDMSRQDYDGKLVPPVKARLAKLKAAGKTPAVLLVYGIPLRVGGVALTKAEQELKAQINAKVVECQGQALKLIQDLDRLTGGAPPPLKLTYPPLEFLKRARETVVRAQKYLDQQPAGPAAAATGDQITSVLVELEGTSPEARGLMARTVLRQRGRLGLRSRELLGTNQAKQQELQEGVFRGILPDTAQATAAAIRSTNGLLGELKFWHEAQKLYGVTQSAAAVDSELTMILAGPYQKVGWLPNPFNLRYDRVPFIGKVRGRAVMVGRLDGPTPAVARRLVDDALDTEQAGLTGVFYIDSRGLSGQAAVGTYAWFDQHLLHLYDLVHKSSKLKVVLDKNPAVFPPGSCPDAALYCGWYSLKKYVPAFKWQKGAVGYHVASYEASTLKQPESQVWCKRMLEEGVAATLGPVTEPYLFSFPLPDQFFPLLMTGKLSLLEVYFRTVPEASWMQILIGDPLYRPFKKNPAIRLDQLREVPPPPTWK